MNKLINKLPREVVDIIISYTYKPQPIELRNDIISFVLTKQNIINIFKIRYYSFEFVHIQKNLSFHIYNFLIGLKNTYSECKNKLYEISKKNYILNNKNDSVDNIIKYFSNNYDIFRFFWGLLTPEERNHFIDIQKRMDTERQP
jgi:hypothetical protein